MSIFINKDIKKLFIMLFYLFSVFIMLLQLYFWLIFGTLNIMILIFSLLFCVGIFTSCYIYFRRQQQLIENAILQITSFLAGNHSARIESDSEGDLFKLFHEINILATTLNTHATKEQNTKNFLRNTISDISHQLKTPIAALTIYNSLLYDECDDENTVRNFALKSEREVERIDMLVQNLLKITKLDAGTILINKNFENIYDMMYTLKSHFEIRTEQECKQIILSGQDDEIIFCDRNWFMEAVSNIVKNALDHTGPNSQIHITWSSLPSVTQITIKDNGSGIHPEDIHHIFKRFYRSQFSKDTQGIGLGLPLSKAIVEAHDGSISVDSILGNGSTFTLSFLNLTKL